MTARLNLPTVEEGPAAEDGLFVRFRIPRGISLLLRQDGTYLLTRYPWQGDVNASLRAYLGGHVYELTPEEVTSLTDAGYGEYITED